MRSFLHGALGGAVVVALAALLFALVGRDDTRLSFATAAAAYQTRGYEARNPSISGDLFKGSTPYPRAQGLVAADGKFRPTAYVYEFASDAEAEQAYRQKDTHTIGAPTLYRNRSLILYVSPGPYSGSDAATLRLADMIIGIFYALP